MQGGGGGFGGGCGVEREVKGAKHASFSLAYYPILQYTLLRTSMQSRQLLGIFSSLWNTVVNVAE